MHSLRAKLKEFFIKIEADLKETLKGLSNFKGISKIFIPFIDELS